MYRKNEHYKLRELRLRRELARDFADNQVDIYALNERAMAEIGTTWFEVRKNFCDDYFKLVEAL